MSDSDHERAKEHFEVYSIGIVRASICTNLSIEEALERMNRECPTGIESKWALAEDTHFRDSALENGGACPDNLAHEARHYLLGC